MTRWRVVGLALVLVSASVGHAPSVDVNASVESPRGTWFDFRNYSSGGLDLPPFQLDSPTPNAASYAENSDDGPRDATLFASSFGDFNLLFGAALLKLRIRDIPVRYKDRTYGTTNISRFRHGWLLLKMTAFGMLKLKFGRG